MLWWPCHISHQADRWFSHMCILPVCSYSSHSQYSHLILVHTHWYLCKINWNSLIFVSGSYGHCVHVKITLFSNNYNLAIFYKQCSEQLTGKCRGPMIFISFFCSDIYQLLSEQSSTMQVNLALMTQLSKMHHRIHTFTSVASYKSITAIHTSTHGSTSSHIALSRAVTGVFTLTCRLSHCNQYNVM